MSKPIRDLYLQLKRIFNGEELYGDEDEAVDRARRFRIERILPLVVSKIEADGIQQTERPVDLLVSLSGFSPETTVIACAFLKPENLLVLQSAKAARGAETIIMHTELSPSQIEIRKVNPNDPLSIYREVKAAEERIREQTGKEANVVIDITGGKKIMSAAAALAASQLDVPVYYVDGRRYDDALRQPVPGTEELLRLPNPAAVLGDREMGLALDLLAHGDFPASYRRFDKLAKETDPSSGAHFGRDLAHCYTAWCNLDRPGLSTRTEVLRKRLEDPLYRPPQSILDRVRTQLAFLTAFNADPDGIGLTLSYFLIGRHHSGREEYGHAALLYYRTLEHLLCRRLEQHAEGFRCKAPDWSLLHPGLEGDYLRAAEQIFHSKTVRMPDRVGLMEAAVMLYALCDPVMGILGLTNVKAFQALASRIEARNRSMFAHGTQHVNAETCRRFEGYVWDRLQPYWDLQPGLPKLGRYVETLRFVEHL